MRRNIFRIFACSVVFFFAFTLLTSGLNVLAAYVPTDQEKADVVSKFGLPEVPTLPQAQNDQISAVCYSAYDKDNISDDRDTYLANLGKVIQCVACGQLVLTHSIASFSPQTCSQITSQTEPYSQYGAQQADASNKAAQYCTNTCATIPNLVPDQAALASGKINVINVDAGEYEVTRSMLDNQLGLTCGLPTVGIDGKDATVMSCCKQNYDVDDLQGQMVEQAEYGCAPGWVSTVIDFGGKWFHAQSAGLRFVGSLAKGDIGDALKNAGQLPPATFGKAIFNKLTGKSKDKEKRFCFSHIGTFVGERVLQTLPIKSTGIASNALRPTGCVEEALPTVNGQYNPDPNADNCMCMYAEDIPDPADPASTQMLTGGEQFLGAAAAADVNAVPTTIGDNLCKRYLKKSNDFNACMDCARTGGIFTGMGCIGTNLAGITKTIFTLGIGLGGGATLLIIFYGAIMIQTSQGNPEKIKKGRQYINSALLGLMVLISSVLILQVIGADILQIPGIDRPSR